MLYLKIKYRFALLTRSLFFKIGLAKYLLQNRYGERILVFHSIDSLGDTRYNSRFVSKDYFDVFIAYITSHFNVISLDDFYAKKFKPNTLNIALTFDDGLFNNYELVLPILKKYNVTATFFITTIHEKYPFIWPDYIDLVSFYTAKKEVAFDGNQYKKNRKNEFVFNGISLKNRCKALEFHQIEAVFSLFTTEWQTILKNNLAEYWKLMNAAQIKEISENPLFSIGSHAVTHANLIKMDNVNAKKEMVKSKRILEEITGKEISAFAFPFGAYNQNLVDYCEKAGYSKILLLDYNSENDRANEHLKKRFVINPYISQKHMLSCLLKESYY